MEIIQAPSHPDSKVVQASPGRGDLVHRVQFIAMPFISEQRSKLSDQQAK